MKFGKALESIFNTIITEDCLFDFNNIEDHSLFENLEFADRENSDRIISELVDKGNENHCDFEIWRFILSYDGWGAAPEAYIKVEAAPLRRRWVYAYEVMPIRSVNWVTKNPGKGALNPDDR